MPFPNADLDGYSTSPLARGIESQSTGGDTMVSDRKEPRDGFHSERGTHEAPSDRLGEAICSGRPGPRGAQRETLEERDGEPGKQLHGHIALAWTASLRPQHPLLLGTSCRRLGMGSSVQFCEQ